MNQKIVEIIKSRLSKLADDFPEMTGVECAEILRAEIECLGPVIKELSKALK